MTIPALALPALDLDPPHVLATVEATAPDVAVITLDLTDLAVVVLQRVHRAAATDRSLRTRLRLIDIGGPLGESAAAELPRLLRFRNACQVEIPDLLARRLVEDLESALAGPAVCGAPDGPGRTCPNYADCCPTHAPQVQA